MAGPRHSTGQPSDHLDLRIRVDRAGPLVGATGFVRPEDVAGSIPCGDSVDAVAEAAGAFKAGFTDLALVQIGGTEPEQARWPTVLRGRT